MTCNSVIALLILLCWQEPHGAETDRVRVYVVMSSKIPLTSRTVLVGLGTVEQANRALMRIMSGSGLVKKVMHGYRCVRGNKLFMGDRA